MNMANKKQTLIEVARSFSRKINLGHYETADFFCSQKAEVLEKDAVKVSEELFRFCEEEVMKSVGEYGLKHLPEPEPPKTAKQNYIETIKEAPARHAEEIEVEAVQGEERIKEANRDLEEATTTIPEEEASYPKQDELGNNL